MTSLRSRGAPLAAPAEQLRLLHELPVQSPRSGSFEADLAASGWDGLRPAPLEVFQVNLGKLCNMTCAHCHVDAGPDRTESMSRATLEECLAAIGRSGAPTVDVTGGAPELHPDFRWFVDACAGHGLHVIDRCNLSVLLLPRFRGLPEWLAERRVEVAASLPHPRRRNTDAQRGQGAFDASVEALRLLNAAGYGKGDANRRLTLVSNPAGAFLAGSQAAQEREWKEILARDHGVTFDRLLCLNNMPIARFLEWLVASGNAESYMAELVGAFNPAAVAGLMCRNTISVSWDGRLFDCDFNQMLDMDAALGPAPVHVRDFDLGAWQAHRIRTGRHCYGCTAGSGSGCAGATA